MNLSSKRILVTGGTGGVGRALADRLTALGATVVICGRSVPPDAGLHAIRADLAEPGEATRVADEAAGRLGGLDVVVANAAVQYRTPLTLGPEPEVLARARQEIALNLTSVAELAAASWPHLAAAPPGRPEGRADAAFVAVTSGLAFAPKQSAPVYCATKAAVHILLESLRHQARTGTPGVRVQEIVLPLVDTAMTAGREGPARKLTPARAAEAIAHGIARERPVVPVGAARALLALLRVAPPVGRRILRDG
ncbi:SDR family NAD(P)-dependent oxidoreductase [Kitasatospora sp. NPDC056327]|uniref:SDR family NAD(P)-dependent oxidoreductase n=1 Tax=Kitasatospora sp. NPDC056327 TaxID=3345785 RepID=UPI0035DE29C9